MGEVVFIMLVALAIYPLAILGVALTGPHSEAERRQNWEDRHHD